MLERCPLPPILTPGLLTSAFSFFRYLPPSIDKIAHRFIVDLRWLGMIGVQNISSAAFHHWWNLLFKFGIDLGSVVGDQRANINSPIECYLVTRICGRG